MRTYQVMEISAKVHAGENPGELGFSSTINGVFCKASPTKVKGRNGVRMEKRITWHNETGEEITKMFARIMLEE